MAKTIKEMANDAADIFGGDACDKDIYIDGYTDGANAVFEEIEKCILANTEPNCITASFFKIKDKIKELKGE